MCLMLWWHIKTQALNYLLQKNFMRKIVSFFTNVWVNWLFVTTKFLGHLREHKGHLEKLWGGWCGIKTVVKLERGTNSLQILSIPLNSICFVLLKTLFFRKLKIDDYIWLTSSTFAQTGSFGKMKPFITKKIIATE